MSVESILHNGSDYGKVRHRNARDDHILYYMICDFYC